MFGICRNWKGNHGFGCNSWGSRAGSTPDQPNAKQGVLGGQPGLCGLELSSAEIRDKGAPQAGRRTGVRELSSTWGLTHISTHTSCQRCYHPSLSEITWCFLDSFLMQNHSVNDCSNFNSFLIHCLLLKYNPRLLFSSFYCTKKWADFINEKPLQ